MSDQIAFDRLRLAEEAAVALDVADVPRFAGELARVQAALLIRVSAASVEAPAAEQSPEKDGDHVLTAAEAGARLGRSRWWIYDHRAELPRVMLPGGKLGFSARGIERWILKRTSEGLNPEQELLRLKIRESGRSRSRKRQADGR